ncbi:hypothetical protein [Halioxenophilus sp. WMMB6]|uniref:hypothetical protein n=1 Tax=Halioxenophilus sp. WMMB6 TaxID=3073815 RepID=UPI00295EA11B|nr:hypothetical protein [Halioxenophilus sp. WMMB6]
MTSLHNSLADIASGYSVFEKDQVLTEAHLNSVSNYLDDQDRLSRVNLIGVGIVCGLRVSATGSTITLSPGTGITSDGDLVQIGNTVTFDRFKLYSTDAPVYPPLYTGDETMLEAYELVMNEGEDLRANSLDQFSEISGHTLSSMTAVLLVESYIKDNDLCSGTDCDNRGQNYVSQNKLLLIPSSAIQPLAPTIVTARDAARALAEVTTRRALIKPAMNTSAEINGAFASAASAMTKQLLPAFTQLWSNAGFLLADTFPADPTAGWRERLTSLTNTLTNSSSGVQYFYAFIKDLADTWNELRRVMANTVPGCNPDTQAFAKHLLLGDLANPSSHRFQFYPSAAVADTTAKQHIAFLAKKLDTLVANFFIPAASELRITPSRSSTTLEAKAIPIYYQIDSSNSVVNFWNFELSSRKMAAYNYGYHSAVYEAQGAAAEPLAAAIDGFDFFRIEGHIGSSVDSAVAAIETQIANFNLPFTVATVFTGQNRTGIRGRRGAGYTDLNRFHHLLRQDIYHSLDDVKQFNNAFKTNIDQAITSKRVIDEPVSGDGPSVSETSNIKHSTINSKTSAVQQSMNLPYASYRVDNSWKVNFTDTVTNAGEYKYTLGKVVKTEFTTPFDNLIGVVKPDWLDWLDILIDKKDEQRDNKRLLAPFLGQYPGLEPRGGVNRGGTFVLLYDSRGIVIADFCLAHYLIEEQESAVEEPPLPKPGFRPPWVIDNGIKILPSIDHVFIDKLDLFKKGIDAEYTEKFNVQTAYTSVFQDSLNLVSDLYKSQTVAAPTTGITAGYDDAIIGLLADQVAREKTIVENYQTRANDTTLPEETRTFYQKAADQKQQSLAQTTSDLVDYLSVNDSNVSFGSDGYKALQEVNSSVQVIKDNNTATSLINNNLTTIKGSTSNSGLIGGIDAIIGNFSR